MSGYAVPVERLVEKFESLPGIGRKTAQRLAFHVLNLSAKEAQDFADAIIGAKTAVCRCKTCQNLTDREECEICQSPTRDLSLVCVVSDPKDVAAIERTHEFNGVYHVLHGVISPLNHIGPDELTIRQLIDRISSSNIREVIMATNPDTEGEATAMYLSRLLKPFGIKTTRLAYGVPVGAHLEYADEVTLSRALDGRREI